MFNNVSSAANKAKDHMDGEHAESAKNIKMESYSVEDLAEVVTSGKASAVAQFFFKDLSNFGFRTKTVMRKGGAHDVNAVTTSTFFEIKVVNGRFMVCFSEGETDSPKCVSSALEIFMEAGKMIVNVIKDFGGFVLMAVGELLDGAVKLGKEAAKAIGKGLKAAAEFTGEALEKASKKVAEIAVVAKKKAVMIVGSIASFCTFGIFDSTKVRNF